MYSYSKSYKIVSIHAADGVLDGVIRVVTKQTMGIILMTVDVCFYYQLNEWFSNACRTSATAKKMWKNPW